MGFAVLGPAEKVSGVKVGLAPRGDEKRGYQVLYGVFSKGETASDAEWTEQIPVMVWSGSSNVSQFTVTQSFAPVIGSGGIAPRYCPEIKSSNDCGAA
jgi:hypothetical protein